MIAKISKGKNIKQILDYNEKKVDKGQARIIGGENMRSSKEAHEMSYEGKLSRFEKMISAKQNTQHQKVAFHASLSFDPTEKPSDDTLRAIASTYMERMGYDKQPFLIYRHEDTHHPHIHIVSTSVNGEGKKIKDSNDRYKSEEVRKAIEKEFGLVVAQEKGKAVREELSPVELLKGVEYGKTEIKKAISDVVRPVVKEFKLTSMKELESVLSQYRIKPETVRGENKNGKYEGLVFSVTDEKGKRISTGIKASELYSKTSLHNLNLRFEHNAELKKEVAPKTVAAIEKVFAAHSSITKEDLQKKLSLQGINLQYHEGTKGTFGITVIDNKNKALFKGSELGKAYSWNNLQSRLSDSTVEKASLPITPTGTPDKDLLKKAQGTLATIFDKLKKDEKAGEYFESVMIRKLPMLDLVTPLLKQMPELDRKGAGVAVNGYISYKTGKLGEIESKERALFTSGVEATLRFLEGTPEGKATRDDKVRFLNKGGYTLHKEEDRLSIGHSRGEHLRWEKDENLLRKLFGYEQVPKNEPMAILFNKNEKAFIASMQGGVVDVKDITPQNFIYREFSPFLSEQNGKIVAAHLTRSYLGDVLNRLAQNPQTDLYQPESRGGKLAEELEKRGLQIKPVVEGGMIRDYRVRYFEFSEGEIPVGARLKDKLLLDEYRKVPGELTRKYSYLVSLHQSLDLNNGRAIEATLNALAVWNPKFAGVLKAEIKPVLEGKGGRSDAEEEKATRAMLSHLIDRISKYPSETLKEPNLKEEKDLSLRAGGEEYRGPTIKNGARDDDEEGVDSHHSKNRKRGLRPR